MKIDSNQELLFESLIPWRGLIWIILIMIWITTSKT